MAGSAVPPELKGGLRAGLARHVVGDGGREAGACWSAGSAVRGGGVRTVGRRRAANGGTGNDPSADDRDQAGLSIRRDGDRGLGVSGSIQAVSAYDIVRDLCTPNERSRRAG